MTRVMLTLLGGFEARAGARPIVLPKKAQALVAYLALGPKSACSRTELAALLWGDTGEQQARGSLRQALLLLRQAFPSTLSVLSIDPRTVTLNPAAIDLDVAKFHRLIEKGTPAALGEAVTLYRGALLAGLDLNEAPFDAWLTVERERMREAVLNALRRLLERVLAAGASSARRSASATT